MEMQLPIDKETPCHSFVTRIPSYVVPLGLDCQESQMQESQMQESQMQESQMLHNYADHWEFQEIAHACVHVSGQPICDPSNK